MPAPANSSGAIDTLDHLSGPDWYAIFKDLHAAIILDLANNKGRRQALRAGLQGRSGGGANVEAYGRFLSRRRQGRSPQDLAEFEKAVPNHPIIVEE